MKIKTLLLGAFFSLTLHSSIHKKSEWITEAFSTIKQERFSRIKALSYWHENWEEQTGKSILFRIDSTFASLSAYRKGVKSSLFTTAPQFYTEGASYKLLPPEAGLYHSAYTDFGGLEGDVIAHKIFEFETLAKRKITWGYFSNNWIDAPVFPAKEIQTILEMERVPFIRIMLRNINARTEFGGITIDSIVEGENDEDILHWAEQIRDLKTPILIEFCPEPNGDWFPWAGAKVSPEKYAEAHKRVIELTRQAGAENLTWFFHVNFKSAPNESWNTFKNYYPGDDYIDWIGISLYGPSNKLEEYTSFEEMLSKSYPELANLSDNKPLAILEWGIGEEN